MKFSKRKIIVSCCFFVIFLILLFSIKNINTKDNIDNRYIQNNIYGCYEFKKYYTDDFDQIKYDNNCGPTLAINVISYYNDVRGINLFYDDKLQNCYDKICEDVNYTSKNSTNLNNVANGLKKIAISKRIQYSSKKILTKFMV